MNIQEIQERAKGVQMNTYLRRDGEVTGEIVFMPCRLDNVHTGGSIEAVDQLAEECERLKVYVAGLEMQLANADALLSQVEQTEWVERVRSHTGFQHA